MIYSAPYTPTPSYPDKFKLKTSEFMSQLLSLSIVSALTHIFFITQENQKHLLYKQKCFAHIY